MISDSIANASTPMVSSNPKDFAKKKKVNRLAKLKQCKLDARREQWLSQVKNKGNKEESNCGGIDEGSSIHMENKSIRGIEELEIKPGGVAENYGDGSQLHHYSDSETCPSNSPVSCTSSVLALLGSSDSGANFTLSSSSSCRSSSGSSNGCCSGSMSEEDEGDDDDDDCLDDWEAVADALAATDDKLQKQIPDSGLGSSPSEKGECVSQSDSGTKITDQTVFGLQNLKANPETQGVVAERVLVNSRAWRPDDACRPQSLPNLSKQYSFPMNSGRHFGCVGSVWGCHNVGPVSTSCPICYEDFDFTDSSFLPCSCGFRLCLFCHKRILEEDGRCPGCRKEYDSDTLNGETSKDGCSLAFRLARSCSMITRS